MAHKITYSWRMAKESAQWVGFLMPDHWMLPEDVIRWNLPVRLFLEIQSLDGLNVCTAVQRRERNIVAQTYSNHQWKLNPDYDPRFSFFATWAPRSTRGLEDLRVSVWQFQFFFVATWASTLTKGEWEALDPQYSGTCGLGIKKSTKGEVHIWSFRFLVLCHFGQWDLRVCNLWCKSIVPQVRSLYCCPCVFSRSWLLLPRWV